MKIELGNEYWAINYRYKTPYIEHVQVKSGPHYCGKTKQQTIEYYRFDCLDECDEGAAETCNFFETKKAAKAELEKRKEDKIQNYMSKLSTSDELFKFMYQQMLNAEEYTNPAALEAVRRKAKDLLQLDL